MIKYTLERHLKILLIIGIVLMFFSLIKEVYAVQTIFDDVNITKHLTVGTLTAGSCDVKTSTNGTLYCGIDATGGGGSGTNYWQVDSTWMFPNITAGGKNLVNVTTLNATIVNQNGYKVLDFSGGILLANITDPADCTAIQKVTGKTGSSWDCGTDLWNTSSEVDAVINATANRYFQIKANDSINLNGKASSYFWNMLGGIPLTNITKPSNCTANNLVQGFTDSALYCTADLWNTSTQVISAINGTYGVFYQINVTNSDLLDGSHAAAFALAAHAHTISQTNLSQTFAINAGNVTGLSLGYNTSAQVDAAINATANRYFQLKVNDSINLNGKVSSYYLNTDGGITFSNITDIANCSAGYYVNGRVGNAWVCAADVTGGGSGANYWQASGTWMWNNATAGGQPNINMTTVNATNLYQGGYRVLDISGSINWNNLSAGFDLNEAWTNTLGGGNITTGTVTTTQIADGTIVKGDLANAFSINAGNVSAGVFPNAMFFSTTLPMNNITDPTDCAAGSLVSGKTGSVWDCTTDLWNTTAQMIAAINGTYGTFYQINVTNSDLLDAQHGSYYLNINGFNAGNLTSGTISNIAIVSNQWVNTSTGVNASQVFSPVFKFTQDGLHNITWNGTNVIIYG